jgi:integrase
MKLNDTKLRALKPRDRAYKLFDEGGLYLLVQPSGSRWWRWRYWHGGREKLLSLGVYPATSLAQARGRRDEGRSQLAAGIDPSQARKAYKVPQADGFEIVARAWHSRQRWSEEHANIVLRRLEMDVFPYLGRRPIGQIAPPELLAVIRKIEERAIDAAHRALRTCSAVFRYGIATGVASRDTAADLRGALHAAPKDRHHAAITEAKAIGALLRAIDGYHGTPEVRCALRLAPLVFVRPGELRAAEWSEMDLDAAEWNIAAGRMKTRQPHLVPLSAQAVAVLRELLPVTGGGRYVFATGDQPMSESAVNAALRRLGYAETEMTGHGFRAMARTILDEVLGVRPDFIEHQLAHTVRDPLGRAYNRTTHLPERRDMMQRWADYLDGMKNGAEVVPLRSARPG